MDYLWTPWRFRYMESAGKTDRCIFCDLLKVGDEKARIVLRGELNFIILNSFPYTSGHVMIVPYEHVADLKDCKPEALAEMMRLAQRIERALAAEYKPEGFNLGMNLGRAAGAGIAGHLHLHVLPRWSGDSSFITTVAETRVVPEELDTTFEKLRRALGAK
jgi:ATP adenylyltransferase